MFIINQVILGLLLIFAVLTFILSIKRKSSIANYTNFAWIICSFFLTLNMVSSKLYENDRYLSAYRYYCERNYTFK